MVSLLTINFASACQAFNAGSNPIRIFYFKPISTADKLLNESQSKDLEIDTLWNHLLFKKGGCLTGGQYVQNGEFGNEACVMSRTKEWKDFFKIDKNVLSDFLINKIIADTAETRIHTCPFMLATEGEVAVYALQNLYQMNWFDFEEFKEFKNKETTSAIDSTQGWLHEILADENRRALLIDCWTRRAKK